MIALDWIGPALYPSPRRPSLRRPPESYRPGPREAFRGLWLELPEAGGLVRLYDAPHAARPVALQTWAAMVCDLAYRGRGLLTSAVAERWHRLGRCPLDYLWRAVAGTTFSRDGRRSCVGAHAGAVRRAILDGAEVSPRVVARSSACWKRPPARPLTRPPAPCGRPSLPACACVSWRRRRPLLAILVHALDGAGASRTVAACARA